MTETEHVSIPADELLALRESHARLLRAAQRALKVFLGETIRPHNALGALDAAVRDGERLVQR